MEVYTLNEKLSSYELPEMHGLKWLVYSYESGCYDGYGDAVGFDGQQIYIWNLSHCYCYGPFDGSPSIMPIEDYDHKLVLSGIPESCEKKVSELLNAFTN